MNFSWDENKAASNLEKHGISFDEAMLVFADPFLLMNQDRIENGEMRCKHPTIPSTTILKNTR